MTPEDRAWEVVRRAYEERTPAPPERRRANSRLLLAGVAAAGAIAAAVALVTPPGHAVLERVRRAVGIEHAAPALVSLPAKGRLLVVSSQGGGVWVVSENGLKRRLGDYSDAMWSPHGLYVVATTRSDLVTLDVQHGVRWSLPRPGAVWPRWEGTMTDTRIAYMTPHGLRVVAGDGTDDHLLDRFAGDVPPAWDPARLHTLAYYSGGAILLRNADTRQLAWRTPVTITPSSLQWSSDGRLLAVVSPKRVVVLDANGTVRRTVSTLTEGFLDAAFKPGTHDLALSIRDQGRSRLSLVHVDRPGTARVLFAGPGVFGDIVWSPDGTWLLLDWPTANQWLFLHGSRVHAVANIEQQFPRPDRLGAMLQLDDRWCCPR
ncbi:MAG TPA: hypothetical protein VLK36_16515 [Gaiellaceae bacterium]|nr:hypothetical protein [Gaiellaceae bacterium]